MRDSFSWPQSPALAQFDPESRLGVTLADQSANTVKPYFAKRNEQVRVAPTEIVFGSFRVVPTQFLLLERDKPVSLGSRALQLLIVLLQRPGELISKQELMARVWSDVFVQPGSLSVHMSKLRHALRDGQNGNRFIVNIPGRGYSFVANATSAV